MLKILKFILIISVLHCFTNCRNEVKSDWKQEDGYISTKASAIKIAEIVWLNVYGSQIYDDKPFIATLKDRKVWIVEGTLAKNKLGGVPYIEIQKSDGKILKVSHSK